MKKKKLSSGRVGKKPTALPYLMLLPSILLFAAFTYWPFLKSIILSFSYTDKKGNFVTWAGIENYVRVLTSAAFKQTFTNTVLFAMMVCLGTFFVAMFLSLLSSAPTRGGRLYETMYALPMAVASVPAASIFSFLFRKEGGFVNTLLGTDISWLGDPNFALITVAIATIWLGIGSSYIFLLVGFRNVPEDLLESAKLDGAGPIRRALRVSIPMASPQIFFVIFLNITGSFRAFGQIKLLTAGGPNGATTTLIYSMYQNAFMNGRYETACVQAILLFAVVFVVTRIQRYLEDRLVFYK